LTAIRDPIEKDSAKSAAAVASRILERVEILSEHSRIGRPGRVPGTRELVVTGTPFIIPYRLKAERIELLAVLHGRQKWPPKR